MNIKIIKNNEIYEEDKNTLIKSRKYGTHEKVLLENFNYTTYEEYNIDNTPHLRPIEQDINSIKGNERKLNVIGEGSYANVFCYGDSPIVFKKLKHDDPPEESIDLTYIREISALNTLKNISPKVYNINLTARDCEIYMKKYKKDGSTALKDGDFIGREKKTIYNILKSMYYAHKKGFMHLDLKFENLLVDDDNSILLNDWGMATFFPYFTYQDDMITTCSYRPPEVYRSKPYDTSVDMFSCGIMFFELYYNISHTIYNTINVNFKDERLEVYDSEIWDIKNFNKLISRLYRIDIIEQIDETMIQSTFLNQINDISGILLCQQMTCSKPEMRPTFAEALNHPFFDDIREKKFEEISYLDVLKNLPPLNSKGCNTNPSKKLILFEWLAEVAKDKKFNLNFMTYMLSLRLINMYNKDDDSSYQHIGASCLLISSYLTGDNIKIHDIAYYAVTTYDVILKHVYDILNYFKFDFYGSIPLMFLKDTKKLTEEIIIGLISIEIYYDKVRDIQPDVVADILQYDIIGEKSTELWNILTQYRRKLNDMAMMVKLIKHVKSLKPYESIPFIKRDHAKNNDFLNDAYTILANKYEGDISAEIYTNDIREGILVIKDLLKDTKMKFK